MTENPKNPSLLANDADNISEPDFQLDLEDIQRLKLRIDNTISNATEVLSNIDLSEKASQKVLASVLLEFLTLEKAITNEMPAWIGSVIKTVLSGSATYQSLQDTFSKIDLSVRATVEAEVLSEMSGQETSPEVSSRGSVNLLTSEAPSLPHISPPVPPENSASTPDASCGCGGEIYKGTFATNFLVIPVSVDGVEGKYETSGGFAFQVEPHPCEFRSPATCPKVIQKHEEIVSRAPKLQGYILRFSTPKLKEESIAVIRAKKLADIIEGGGIYVDGA